MMPGMDSLWPFTLATPTVVRPTQITIDDIKAALNRIAPSPPREVRAGSLDAVRRIAPERPLPPSAHAPGGLTGQALTGVPVVVDHDLPRDVVLLRNPVTGEVFGRWTIPVASALI